MPVVDFEDENGVDSAGAMESANRTVSNLTWDENDILFYFQQAEAKMAAAGVKKQFTKFQILSSYIPKKVQDQVKPLLRLKESQFTDNDAYKKLKEEILRIFGPKPEKAVERALNRVMSDKPSHLARELVNDICDKQLNGCCCDKIISALWRRHLPSNVKSGIARQKFNKDTFNEVLQLADDIFESNDGLVAGRVAAVRAPALDETQPAIPYAAPEVAATGGFRGGRGRGRGGWRGGRGGRGRGGSQATPANQSSGPRFRGPKHPDLPDGEWSGCQMHHRWGRGAYFCSEPLTCLWKNVLTPKPAK